MPALPAAVTTPIDVPISDQGRRDEDDQRRHLHLVGLDLLAEILRRAPDHEAGHEDGDDREHEHAVEPEPTPPYTTSPSWISHSGTSPPIGVNESCIALTEPLEADVVAVAHSAELAMPNRTSLPSMLPPDCSALAAWSTPCLTKTCAVLLGDDADDQQPDEDDGHGREHRPALAGVADHDAERVAERGGDLEDGQQLEPVG